MACVILFHSTLLQIPKVWFLCVKEQTSEWIVRMPHPQFKGSASTNVLDLIEYCLTFIWQHSNSCKNQQDTFLAHLTQRVMWAIAITWRPSSSSIVRRKLFQKSSTLKVLDQWKPNLVWIITRVSSSKIVSGDAVHQPTWPRLLKIEHMVKLQVFG